MLVRSVLSGEAMNRSFSASAPFRIGVKGVACAVIASAFVLGACGSSNGVTVPGDPDAGITDPDAALAADAGASDSGTASNPDANKPTGDAATAVDGAVPDGAPPADTRIDPIEVGHAWTYNVHVLGYYPSCENGIGVATTVSKGTKGGKTSFQVQSLCKDAGTYEYSVDGDKVYYWYDNAWRVGTDTPVQAGHTWSDDTYDYVWEDAGTQVTPAGTFTNCWNAKRDVSYDSYTIFCRGVGPVHWHYEDGLGNGYDAILTNKNF